METVCITSHNVHREYGKLVTLSVDDYVSRLARITSATKQAAVRVALAYHWSETSATILANLKWARRIVEVKISNERNCTAFAGDKVYRIDYWLHKVSLEKSSAIQVVAGRP